MKELDLYQNTLIIINMLIQRTNQIKNTVNPLGQVKSGVTLWGDVQLTWDSITATWG